MGKPKVSSKKLTRIAVANRGEIARRIIHTIRASGKTAIAFYAENDQLCPFVKEANESFSLGEGSPQQTYLDQDVIIAAAKAMKVDAIHPGYGFLSENAVFARAVQEAGLVFIGPQPEHIEMMGDKLEARAWAIKNDVPLVPGFETSGVDDKNLKEKIKEVGYPLLIKAAAGGGGKGMKIVEKEEDFKSSLLSASREAEKAFADGRVYVEKYLRSPRHIEVQLLSDAHGQHFHILNRDCSLQRRYQKIVEEAPAPNLSEKVTKTCYDVALKIAKAMNYLGVGTIEFVVSGDDAYFLEMNTRLQVEHPVTEMITGLDLVRMQLRVAEGEKLDLKQDDIKANGHALEARIYAENPDKQFLPVTGKIQTLNSPAWQGVRYDFGYEEESEILDCYDPLIGKIIAHGCNREEARRRLLDCLRHTQCEGTISNLLWLSQLLNHSDFINMNIDTQYIDRGNVFQSTNERDDVIDAMMAAVYLLDKTKVQDLSSSSKDAQILWLDGRLMGFRNT